MVLSITIYYGINPNLLRQVQVQISTEADVSTKDGKWRMFTIYNTKGVKFLVSDGITVSMKKKNVFNNQRHINPTSLCASISFTIACKETMILKEKK